MWPERRCSQSYSWPRHVPHYPVPTTSSTYPATLFQPRRQPPVAERPAALRHDGHQKDDNSGRNAACRRHVDEVRVGADRARVSVVVVVVVVAVIVVGRGGGGGDGVGVVVTRYGTDGVASLQAVKLGPRPSRAEVANGGIESRTHL